MKRKTTALLTICMITALAAGCGNSKNNSTDGTESVEAGTENGFVTASADITYNVDDYVKLGDYMDVAVTLNEADYQVTDDDVNNYADQMIAYYKPFLPDDSHTVVEADDFVDVDYVGKKDGEAFDGGSAEGQIIDVAGNCDATSGNGYIEGFSEGLIGASVGDTVDHEVTFPDDYSNEDLKGQTVTFTFTINAIDRKVTRDMIDDSYVKDNFDSDSVDDFYSDIRTVLNQQAENGKETDIRSKVVDAVMDKCSVELPDGLLDARLEEYIDGFTKQNCTNGITLADYLQQNYNTNEDDFRKQCRTYMEDNLKQELVFEAIVNKENIQFDEDKFNDYISMVVKNGGFDSEDTLYETYGTDKEAGKAYLQKIYLQSEACSKIADQADVTYETETETVADTEAS